MVRCALDCLATLTELLSNDLFSLLWKAHFFVQIIFLGSSCLSIFVSEILNKEISKDLMDLFLIRHVCILQTLFLVDAHIWNRRYVCFNILTVHTFYLCRHIYISIEVETTTLIPVIKKKMHRISTFFSIFLAQNIKTYVLVPPNIFVNIF